MRGFSLVNTIVATFIFTALGFALLIMSDEGFRITKSNINHNVAEANADYALNAALEHLLNGGNCEGSQSGSLNGGSWEYRMYQTSSGQCFILASGRKDNAVRYKIAYAGFSGGGGLGTLTVNYMEGDYFHLINNSHIRGTDNCPALAYYDCGDLCEDIEREKGEGQIDEVARLREPVDINELLFKEGKSISDVKDFVLEQFNDTFENFEIPSPPVVISDECKLTGVNRCEIKWNNNNVVVCGSKEVDTSNCSAVLISGNNVTIDFWNGNINANLIIQADKVEVSLGNTSVNGDLFIQADEKVETLEANNDTNITGSVVISSSEIEKVNLVNDSRIRGNLIINLEGADENTEVKFTNSAGVDGDFYFKGHKLMFNPVNNSYVGGNLIVKTDDEIDIDMPNNSSINGRMVLYSEEIHFRGVNRSNVGGGENNNIILADDEIEIELTNRSSQENIGYVVTLNDDGEIHLKLTNRTNISGLFLTDEFEADLVNETSLSGIVITRKVEDEIRMPNDARIKGLLVVLGELEELELVNSAKIEGLVLLNELGDRLRLTNNAEIVPNLDLINSYIDLFGLSDYLNQLSCDILGGGSGSLTFPQHLVGSIY